MELEESIIVSPLRKEPLEARLTDLKSRLHEARPIGQHVDGLGGGILSCQKRLAEAEAAKVETCHHQGDG